MKYMITFIYFLEKKPTIAHTAYILYDTRKEAEKHYKIFQKCPGPYKEIEQLRLFEVTEIIVDEDEK